MMTFSLGVPSKRNFYGWRGKNDNFTVKDVEEDISAIKNIWLTFKLNVLISLNEKGKTFYNPYNLVNLSQPNPEQLLATSDLLISITSNSFPAAVTFF